MQYLFSNQPVQANLYHVKLWNYSLTDRILIKAIQEQYRKPENWQFHQPKLFTL